MTVLPRPVEITLEQVKRWESEGCRLGLVKTYRVPELIRWKPESEKPNTIVEAETWHNFGDGWCFVPAYHDRRNKVDIQAFTLEPYNEIVRIYQKIHDLEVLAEPVRSAFEPYWVRPPFKLQ